MNSISDPFIPPAEIRTGPTPQKVRTPRRKRILVAVGSVLLVYALSYVALSNRGIRQMDQHGMGGILYTDADSTFQSKDLRIHWLLSALFGPANEIDCMFFGGEAPIRCIMFDLAW